MKTMKSKGVDFDDISVLSSPHLRCLQTAYQVNQVLSKKTINVDYLLNEGVQQKVGPGVDPFADLALRACKDQLNDALKKAKIVDAATFGRNSPRGKSPRGRSTSPRNSASTGGDQLLNPENA